MRTSTLSPTCRPNSAGTDSMGAPLRLRTVRTAHMGML